MQQYPAGVWVGTTGIGSTGPKLVAWIDGGSAGTGGQFFMAKEPSGNGFDALYGSLNVSTAALRASGSTYFSTVDGKFSTVPITISGTVTGASNASSKANARISGAYTNPSDTAANAGSNLVPFSLNYSPELYERDSSLAQLQGTYGGGGAFGSGFAITVDGSGNFTGDNAGCTLSGGKFTIRDSNFGIYGISVNVVRSDSCAASTQRGIAFLDYDETGAKSGIWIFTTNASGTRNAFVLRGAVAGDDGTLPDPSDTQQMAAGVWSGTLGGETIEGIVLPTGDYFFYKKVGNSYDVLTGSLRVETGSSRFSSSMLYYNSAAATASQYVTNVSLTGNVTTRSSLIGSFQDPSTNNSLSQFTLAYQNTPTLFPVNLAMIADRKYTNSTGFGGAVMEIIPRTDGTFTGTSGSCTISGRIAPSSQVTYLFSVSGLKFAGAACDRTTLPDQSGQASVVVDGTGKASQLRILALGVPQDTSGSYANTVFLGAYSGDSPPPVIAP